MKREELANVPAQVVHITNSVKEVVYEGPRVKAWNYKIRCDNSKCTFGNFIVTLKNR